MPPAFVRRRSVQASRRARRVRIFLPSATGRFLRAHGKAAVVACAPRTNRRPRRLVAPVAHGNLPPEPVRPVPHGGGAQREERRRDADRLRDYALSGSGRGPAISCGLSSGPSRLRSGVQSRSGEGLVRDRASAARGTQEAALWVGAASQVAALEGATLPPAAPREVRSTSRGAGARHGVAPSARNPSGAKPVDPAGRYILVAKPKPCMRKSLPKNQTVKPRTAH